MAGFFSDMIKKDKMWRYSMMLAVAFIIAAAVGATHPDETGKTNQVMNGDANTSGLYLGGMIFAALLAGGSLVAS